MWLQFSFMWPRTRTLLQTSICATFVTPDSGVWMVASIYVCDTLSICGVCIYVCDTLSIYRFCGWSKHASPHEHKDTRTKPNNRTYMLTAALLRTSGEYHIEGHNFMRITPQPRNSTPVWLRIQGVRVKCMVRLSTQGVRVKCVVWLTMVTDMVISHTTRWNL